MSKHLYLTFCVILFSFCVSWAQERELIPAQKLTISEGLAHNGVTSILEDSKGYLWVGTYDGLNRYDGYEIKVFKNTPSKSIFVSNRIRTICEDQRGNLWIGTDEGVSVYDYSQERFQNIYSNSLTDKDLNGPIVRRLLVHKNKGLILAATEGEGLIVFKDDFTFYGQYVPPDNFADKEILFFDGLAIDEANYLLSTSVGLVLFNLEQGTFNYQLKNEVYYSNALIRIDENRILATLSSGIGIFSYEELADTYSFQLETTTLGAYRFNSASLDQLGNLWLGTLTDGVIHIDNAPALVQNKPVRQSFFTTDTGRLRASCFATVENRGCWVGTFDKGIFRFDLKENPFRTYHAEMDYEFGLASNDIMHVAPLDDHRLYITANRGGIALFNTYTERFEPAIFDVRSTSTLGVGAVFVDSKGNTWMKIAGPLGLSRVRAGQRAIETISGKEVPIPKNTQARSIKEDKWGNIWVGGLDGVFRIRFNQTGDVAEVEALNEHPFFLHQKLALVRTLYVDPLHDYLWVGTDADGLFRIGLKDNTPLNMLPIDQFRHDINDKTSLPSNFVTSIIRLPNGELWLGTEGAGVCKVDNSEGALNFRSFSEKQGLSNNVVKSLVLDGEHTLWVSTNIGLNKFDTRNHRFRSFRKADGLPFENFHYAGARLANGLIFLSGLDGVCYFDPKEVVDREMLPKLEFGELKLFNTPILPGDTIASRILLPRRLTEMQALDLRHNENVFSIEVKSLHFSTPDNHYLKYQLLPINPDWIEVPSNQKYLYYNGLQPGEYTLQVMASDALGNWTDTKELKISIAPPFWKTPLAYLIYILVIGLLIYIGVFVILRIQALNHKLEIEKLEKDTAKELNTAKLRFFSNISHEVKTPLTLISGPVDLLAKRYKGHPELQEKLKIVQRQSKKIVHLIDQVHDFQKADAHLLEMQYDRFCFNDFIEELIADFEFLAKSDQKVVEISRPDGYIYVSADRDKLEKVFNNLFNNAFKYTKPGDTIKVEYKSEDKDLIVWLSDTGQGIDPNDLPHIFERFYRSQKKQRITSEGSGIGLAFSKRLVEMHYGYIDAESELEKGTTMKVRLPVVKEDLIADQSEKERAILSAEKTYAHQPFFVEKEKDENISAAGVFSEALIFFAEDNADMRAFVSEVLSKFFTVKAFRTGQECLDAMEDEWPDLVISDVMMPELNGLELCKQIKADIKTSHIPIILLTACTTIEDQIQGIKDGADAYIKKPFNIQHLVTKTEALLLNRQQLRERFQVGIPLTRASNKNSRNDNAFLEKLYTLMAKNLDNQDLDLDVFAKELYLNRTHFYQKVKALTNHTPYELLKEYRLKRAAELLGQERLSVNEVFAMTGFKSRTHFSKLFKEKYQATPGKYHQQLDSSKTLMAK